MSGTPEGVHDPGPGPAITVGLGLVRDLVRRAAIEAHGVVRVGSGGGALRALLAGPPVIVRLEHGRVDVRIVIVARPGESLPDLAVQVRRTVVGTVGRLLGLEPGRITVVIDGVGE